MFKSLLGVSKHFFSVIEIKPLFLHQCYEIIHGVLMLQYEVKEHTLSLMELPTAICKIAVMKKTCSTDSKTFRSVIMTVQFSEDKLVDWI